MKLPAVRSLDGEIVEDQPSVIFGSLVDIKNVAAHKSVRLVIDVPAEHAQQVIAAMGWPTMVEPVPVSVARLEDEVAKALIKTIPSSSNGRTSGPEPANRGSNPREGTKEPRPFRELPPATQAVLMCKDEAFQRFVREKKGWLYVHNEEAAANFIRAIFNIESRSQLKDHARSWRDFVEQYLAWLEE